MMTEVPWERNGPGSWVYTDGTFTYRRKGKEGAYRYAVYKGNELVDNSLRDEFAVLRWIRDWMKTQPFKGYFGFRG